MTDQELRELIASLAIKSDRLDAQLEKTSRELSAQQAETDALVKRIAKMVGDISNNQRDVAEEFFYNTLADKMTLAGVKYDFVDHNWRHSIGSITDEFDIVMVNGEDVAIIEVKYKAHDRDLDKLINKKYPNFKTLYPQYRDYKHHLVLATFHINEDLKREHWKKEL